MSLDQIALTFTRTVQLVNQNRRRTVLCNVCRYLCILISKQNEMKQMWRFYCFAKSYSIFRRLNFSLANQHKLKVEYKHFTLNEVGNWSWNSNAIKSIEVVQKISQNFNWKLVRNRLKNLVEITLTFLRKKIIWKYFVLKQTSHCIGLQYILSDRLEC